ncbi:NYN domain-containing protein [Halostreptopolyspora alba]|uniref:RNA-binding protein n=1 Tax=Halostreptopolyspora alba TaxID=2487137 RepID=A0A3N0EET2_9ACTN|nr:RNA-binding protein [Nocardiopsaceae bacterium YIM 96095]
MSSDSDEAVTGPGEPDGQAPGSGEEPAAGEPRRPLPESVRSRVIDYGSDVLGGLRASEVPSGLRRVAKFQPRRRARLAGPQIAAHLESDPEFRARVAARVEHTWPELARELGHGTVPPAADPVAVAAAAYLLRPPGWPDIVDRIRVELEQREAAREAEEAAETIADLRRRLEEAKNDQRAELDQARSELREYRRTTAELRREVHAERQRAKKAEERVERADQEAEERSASLASRVNELEAENRRLRNRLEASEAQLENSRRAARDERNADEARLRVLLDVLLGAAHGMRRELALPSSIESPADLVTGERQPAAGGVPGRGLPDDDPGLIDHLLTLPRVHLLIDGYNVTKAGYGTLPLADQRNRLMSALEGLASRTKAEITCVFDGADVPTPPVGPATRRVRLLFSAAHETADDLIIRLVGAEPPGRPLAVVTSDNEVVSAVRRAGARTVASAMLLRRLEGSG